jgi:hypothetical protein
MITESNNERTKKNKWMKWKVRTKTGSEKNKKIIIILLWIKKLIDDNDDTQQSCSFNYIKKYLII